MLFASALFAFIAFFRDPTCLLKSRFSSFACQTRHNQEMMHKPQADNQNALINSNDHGNPFVHLMEFDGTILYRQELDKRIKPKSDA